MSVLESILKFFGLLQYDPDTASTPMIMVKLLDTLALDGTDQGTTYTLDQLATKVGAPSSTPLENLHASTSGLTFAWAFPSMSAADLAALAALATEEDASYQAPKFDHYLEIVCPAGFDTGTLVDALNAWTDAVEYAYAMPPASDPVITGAGNPLFQGGSQGYLGAAPDGVDVQAAWAKNADGSGLNVIDIEQGWFFTQEDLPQSITQLGGTNQKASFFHGAAVLGEMVALDNTTGIVGAAPNATARTVSYNDLKPGVGLSARVADRIYFAAHTLSKGDVILLEIQFQGKVSNKTVNIPVETDPLVFDAIHTATSAGVIVVEAAGNGSTRLDDFVMASGPNKGKKTLSRSTPSDFAESNAIMVGSSTSTYPLRRFTSSNFGSRIDCYAWGENIVTCGWDPGNPSATNIYFGVNLRWVENGVMTLQFFGGTSGASPIIASCCLLVQHLRSLLTPKSGTGKLNSAGMRSVLSDSNNGSASFLVSDEIGVMPDLKKIIANEFNP